MNRGAFFWQMMGGVLGSARAAAVEPAASPGGADEAPKGASGGLQIRLVSVLVQDQAAALTFYTEALGFVKKQDLPLGDDRWLTVESPAGAEGVELLLEPARFPPAREYQKALFEAGLPAVAFASRDVRREHERLRELGVRFRSGPADVGLTTVAVFEDTCGNLVQMFQI